MTHEPAVGCRTLSAFKGAGLGPTRPEPERHPPLRFNHPRRQSAATNLDRSRFLRAPPATQRLCVIFFLEPPSPACRFRPPSYVAYMKTFESPGLQNQRGSIAMTKNFSQTTHMPLPQPTISRYTLSVDNYAKAPLRRLFQFVAVSGRTGTPRNSLIRQGLHTLISRPNASPALSIASTHFQKHTGVYPTYFESPAPLPWMRSTRRLPVAAIASQIAGLSTDSWRDRSAKAGLVVESASRSRTRRKWPSSIFTCNKKAISPTLTGNATPTIAVNVVIPTVRINLQETDR